MHLSRSIIAARLIAACMSEDDALVAMVFSRRHVAGMAGALLTALETRADRVRLQAWLPDTGGELRVAILDALNRTRGNR